MDEQELKVLQQASPILEIAVELGIKLRSNMGQCFRGEKHAAGAADFSLFFNPAENSFFCRACEDVGGDVIDLVCQCKGWPRDQAIEWLAHRRTFDLETRDKYYGRADKRRPFSRK
jgi:hypothetical protein